jgi:hypothetical protein
MSYIAPAHLDPAPQRLSEGKTSTLKGGSGFMLVQWAGVVLLETLLGAWSETIALIIITEIT